MNKKAILIGSLAIVGVGAYFVLKPKKRVDAEEVKPETVKAEEVFAQPSTPASQPSTQLNPKKVLSFGSKGKEVEELQKRLGGLTPDGSFGLKTQAKLVNTFSVTKITLEQLNNWLPKVEYVQTIFPSLKYTFTRTGLYPLDLEFLKVWASAIKKKEPFFEYKSKTYSSATGKGQQQVTTLGGLVTFK